MKKRNSEENSIVRMSLQKALLILMDEKTFRAISITELCKKAGVSRMAYYRNFSSKEDLFRDYLDRLFEDYRKEVLSSKRDRFQAACLYFSYFRCQREFLDKLLRARLGNLLLEQFPSYLEILLKSFTDIESYYHDEEIYVNGFFSGGLYQILIVWLRNGMHESDEKMAALVFRLMTGKERPSSG